MHVIITLKCYLFNLCIFLSFPGGCTSHESHAGAPCSSGGGANQAPPPTADTETEMQEQLEEEDDPVLLARRRAMDEYKDDHRRGEGNRHNRS